MDKRATSSEQRPFGPRFSSPLYAVPSWKEQIDLVGHLALQSQNVLVFLGEQGSGKTSFSKLLRDTQLPSLKKIMLSGKSIHSIDGLMKAVAEAFHLPWPISGELTGKVVHYGTEDEGVLTKLIIVDDAHTLNDEVLCVLLRLVNHSLPTKEQIHLVLTGDYPFEERLKEPEYEILLKDRVHCMELGAWKAQDIQYILQEKGAEKSESLVEALLQKTQGHPRQVMKKISMMPDLKRLQSAPWLKAPLFQKISEKPVTAGVTFGVLLGLTLLLLNSGDEAQISQDSIQQVAQRPSESMPQPFEETQDVGNNPQAFDEVQIAENNADQLSFEEAPYEEEAFPDPDRAADSQNIKVSLPRSSQAMNAQAEQTLEKKDSRQDLKKTQEVAQAQAVHKPRPQAAQNITDLDATAKKPETKPKQKLAKQAVKEPTSKEAKDTTQKPQPKKMAQKKQTTFPKGKLAYDEQFLMSQSGDSYTLQLVASTEAQNIKDFLKKHDLEDIAQVAHYHAKGKPWYVVIYGTFNSPKEAEYASKSLPDMKPWVRSISGLQDQIEQRRKLDHG